MTTFVVALVSVVVPSSSGATVPPGPDPVQPPAPAVVEVFEKHLFPTHEHEIEHPSGATYLDDVGLLAVAEDHPDGSVISLLDLQRDALVSTTVVEGLTDARTLADDGDGTLAALDGQTLITWSVDGEEPDVQRTTVEGQSLAGAAGMTYDPLTQRWIVLDAERERVVVLDDREATPNATDGPLLEGVGATALRGIAIDAASGRIFVAEPAASLVHVVAVDGSPLETLDVDDVDTTTLSAITLGATADPTDAPQAASMYLALRGEETDLGWVSEISLEPLGSGAAEAALSSTGTLVRASHVSELTPPSPDPSGIVYMTDRHDLLMVDSEVDEMAIYSGANMWRLSRDAETLTDTGTTLGFSREPTGVGYDPVGKRVFVSDDDRARVAEILAGADNRFGTADDYVTWFSTTALGNDDVEDVTYDPSTGDLFLAQGVGAEVWRVSPGPNGLFDGVPPTGDDGTSRFDVGVYGITDLEGIGYSETRDSLFLTDRKLGKVLEVTKDGALVQTIDVAGLGMHNPSGITLAPATDDPTRTSLYVVTRGVDNDNHPDENDGMLFEIAAPHLVPVGVQANAAPVVSAGPDLEVKQPSSAILRGTVSDDGQPNPPGFTTETWTMVSGPGTVTFGDPTAAVTTASFGVPGTYVLRLTSSDTELVVADDVTVEVSPASAVNTPPSVFAGGDRTVTLPGSVLLRGFRSDDGLPSPPGAATVSWSKVSGPGAVTFSAPGATRSLASFAVSGTYVLRLTADDSELSAFDELTVVVNPPRPSGNLVKNAGFEVDTAGWKGSAGADVTRVAAPRSGGWAGEVASTGTAPASCTLNDSPNWIPVTQPGAYVLRAWVKGDAAGEGATVRLVGNEYVDGTRVGSRATSVTLTTGWQELELTYLPAVQGSWLDINVVRTATPPGAVCFLVDDVSAEISGAAPPNEAPVVDAGADDTVVLPGSLTLTGATGDDGLPDGVVATTWTAVAGPGTVTFADAAALHTSASFSQAGTYVLRLTADDSELSAFDELVVVVQPAGELRNLVQNPGFEVDTSGWKGAGDTTVTRVPTPRSGEWAGEVTNVAAETATCRLNDSPNWVPVTEPGVYVLGAWVRGDAAAAGADVRLVAHEYVDSTRVESRSTSVPLGTDWRELTMYYVATVPGSWLDVNLVRSGTPAGAACFLVDDLSVAISVDGPENAAPTVDAGADATVVLPAPLALAGTVDDDGLPAVPGAVTVAWSQVEGPGTVTFTDAAAATTTATFSHPGSYVLRLEATDGELSAAHEVTVTVEPVGPVELVANSGLEVGTSGWKGSSGVTVTRVATPRSGGWSAEVANASAGTARCTLNDSPNWIPTSQPGSYTLSAWVRGDAAGAGATVRLATYEYEGSTRVGSAEASVELTTAWQKLELSYVPTSPGTSWLDFNVVRPSTPRGTVCFLADDLSAQIVPVATP